MKIYGYLRYRWRSVSAFVAEALDVFGAFLEGADVAALDELANLLDDVGIGEGGDVAGVHVVGDGGEDAAHNFSGAGLGHVRNDVDALGPGDFADHGFGGGDHFVLDGLGGRKAGVQGDLGDWDAAFAFINHGTTPGLWPLRHILSR